MKLQLTIEVDGDETPCWRRIVDAQLEYIQHVQLNNLGVLRRKRYHPDHDLGLTAGPNVFTAANGVRITEKRVDWAYRWAMIRRFLHV